MFDAKRAIEAIHKHWADVELDAQAIAKDIEKYTNIPKDSVLAKKLSWLLAKKARE